VLEAQEQPLTQSEWGGPAIVASLEDHDLVVEEDHDSSSMPRPHSLL